MSFTPKSEKALRRICGSIVVLLLVISAAHPQSGRRPATGQQPGQDEAIRLRAEEVLLNVTVLDSYGHQATELIKDEFIVAEDGQRQDIASFLISSVPVNVVLMLDASGSVVSEINSLRDAAMHFVGQLGPEDKISVIEFHTNVELIQDWTAKADDVRHALSWRFKPGMVQTKQGSFTYVPAKSRMSRRSQPSSSQARSFTSSARPARSYTSWTSIAGGQAVCLAEERLSKRTSTPNVSSEPSR